MGWDYTTFSDFYQCSGTGGLIGENANNFTEQGVVAEDPVGKFGVARGPCDGNFGAGGRGFSASFGAGSVYDLRISQGFKRCSMVGWFRLDGNAGDQEFASQGRSGAANNTKQWMLRGVMQDGADDIAVLFIWDHAANVFRVAAATRGGGGAMPLGVWCMIGFAVDIPALKARIALGVPGEDFWYDERDINTAWNAFQATALDTTMIGIGSGHSTEGIDGDVDHITWRKGRAYKQVDFRNHWQNSNGLPRSRFRRGDDAPLHVLAARAHAARGGR